MTDNRVGGEFASVLTQNSTPENRLGGEFAAVLTQKSKYYRAIRADNPLAYYRLDETSGSVMNDSGPSARHGTYTSVGLGASPLVNDLTDKAADFTGSASYASIPNASWMDLTSTITVECWITPDTVTGTHDIVARDQSGVSGPWHLYASGTTINWLLFKTSTQTLTSTGFTLTIGQTYHLVATYDGATMKLYINGVLNNSVAATGNMPTNTARPISIGRYEAGQYFDGRIDEVAIYGTALNSTQIANHYSLGTVHDIGANSSVSPVTAAFQVRAAAPTPDYVATVLADTPLAYWHLDETSGTTAVDSSGNGRDSTYSVAPTSTTGLVPTISGGKSVDFNKNNFARIANAAWMDPATFSAEFWYNADGTNSASAWLFAHATADSGLGASNQAFAIFLDSSTGKLSAYLTFTDGTNLLLALESSSHYGVTRHVVLTWDGTWMRGYINGVQVVSSNASAGKTVRTGAAAMTVGSDSSSSNYGTTKADARIDEAAYYGTALTAAQIANHYLVGTSAQMADMTTFVPGVTSNFAVSVGSLSVDVTMPVSVPAVTSAFSVQLALPVSLAGSIDGPTASFSVQLVLPIALAGSIDGPTASFAVASTTVVTMPAEVPAIAAMFDMTEVDNTPISLSAEVPAITSALAISVRMDVSLAAEVPAISSDFAVMPRLDLAVAGVVPAVTSVIEIELRDGPKLMVWDEGDEAWVHVDPAPNTFAWDDDLEDYDLADLETWDGERWIPVT